MDRFYALEADVYRAVDRRAGRAQDADDAKRLVIVINEAHVAGAMADHDRLTQLV